MTTIRDIAKLTGVSVATVSRVLNNESGVGDKTRVRVKKVIEDLNYVPNQVARSLYQQKSNLIGVIIPDLKNSFYADVVTGVEHYFAKKGYHILLSFNTGSSFEKYKESLTALNQNNVSGIISSAFDISTLSKFKAPLVFFNSGTINDNIPRIISNNFHGGQLSVQALLTKKPKHVILQHGPLDLATTRERFEGALTELTEKHIEFEIQVVPDFDFITAKASARQLFDRLTTFDAVIAANDIHAMEISKEAGKRNIKIPEQFQLVGYDGSIFSELSYPIITTVDQHAEKIGRLAAEHLYSLLSGNVDTNNVLIDVALHQADSTYSL